MSHIHIFSRPAVTSDPTNSVPQSSPAISLLASNLKNTQTLLTALQKSLPPNSNLPANIKSLAQRVLQASPIARSQLQGEGHGLISRHTARYAGMCNIHYFAHTCTCAGTSAKSHAYHTLLLTHRPSVDSLQMSPYTCVHVNTHTVHVHLSCLCTYA